MSQLAAHVHRHLDDKFQAYPARLLPRPPKQTIMIRSRFPAISLPARFGSLHAAKKFPAGPRRDPSRKWLIEKGFSAMGPIDFPAGYRFFSRLSLFGRERAGRAAAPRTVRIVAATQEPWAMSEYHRFGEDRGDAGDRG